MTSTGFQAVLYRPNPKGVSTFSAHWAIQACFKSHIQGLYTRVAVLVVVSLNSQAYFYEQTVLCKECLCSTLRNLFPQTIDIQSWPHGYISVRSTASQLLVEATILVPVDTVWLPYPCRAVYLKVLNAWLTLFHYQPIYVRYYIQREFSLYNSRTLQSSLRKSHVCFPISLVQGNESINKILVGANKGNRTRVLGLGSRCTYRCTILAYM